MHGNYFLFYFSFNFQNTQARFYRCSNEKKRMKNNDSTSSEMLFLVLVMQTNKSNERKLREKKTTIEEYEPLILQHTNRTFGNVQYEKRKKLTLCLEK